MTFNNLKEIIGFPDGKTVVCYTHDGKEAVTGGVATGIKVYDTEPGHQDYVRANIIKHSEDVECIAVSNNGFASGGTDGLVLLYTSKNLFDKILVRSTVPVRDLAYHPNGTKLAIATDDNDIRVVLVADNSKIVLLKGHKSTVKSICYDTKGDFIVSSDVQGNILIWSVGPKEPAPRIVKSLPGLTYKASMDSVLQTKVAWSPDNTCFAFPGTNQDIRIFSSGMWTPFYTLEGEHTENVITMAWSPNGYYLATSSQDKLLVIWDTKTKTKVSSNVNSSYVTGLAWSPDANQLAITDVYGLLRFWDNVIPTDNSNYPHPAIMRQVKNENRLNMINMADDEASEMEDHGEDLDIGDDVNMLFDDDDDEVEEEGEDVGEDVGDFVIDDDGAGYTETPEEAANSRRLKTQQSLNLGANNAAIIQRQRKFELAFDPPTTFQPGETPYHKPEANKTFDPAQGERRYMAYNLVGVITTIFEEAHSIINVEFHDQSAYRNFHFTDVFNYSMAAISTAGTVYAVESKEAVKKSKKLNADGEESDSDDEEEKTLVNSTLYYRPNNWGSDKDWTHHMLPGEDIISVAINRVSVIATTSLGYVRIFSISGVQRHIFSLENVVSVTAMTDLALFVYSTGPSFTGQQNLKYILLNTDSNEILQKDDLHITTDSEVNWIGFTETNQAAVYDTAGVLRILQRQRRPDQGCWVPVFDGKTHAAQKNEKYWPVGILRDRLMCVILRGNNLYPFFPRPPVKDISLQLPLLEMSTEVGQLEEQILRVNTCNLHEKDEAEATNTEQDYDSVFRDADIEMDIALLKLINLACKAEKVSRALDLSYILHSSDSIDKAIRIASFHRYSSLAQKMTNIKETKFMGDEINAASTLADSFAALPSIYTSRETALDGDLALVNKSSKRVKEDLFMFDDDDDSMLLDDEPVTKKAKPFQFSS